MPDMEDPSPKPPPISEMFQKFAQAFKTKTIEFFAEDDDDDDPQDPPFSLLDSADEVIPNQRVVVIKPDSIAKPNPAPPQTLIPSVFATIASFEASYLQLQTAHSPFDAPAVEAADRAAVGQLKKLWEMNKWYGEFKKGVGPTFTPNLSVGSRLEAEVQENQSLLRTLEMLVNRLQAEIDAKDAEVLVAKQKLRRREEANSKRAKKLLNCQLSSSYHTSGKLLSLTIFDSVLRYVCKSCRRFTKILVDLMRKVGWDLDSAAGSVYRDVEYAKIGHSGFAFLSYVCLGMFRGFDSEGFLLEDNGIGIECNGGDEKKSCLSEFLEHATGDAIEILNSNQNGCFARFCEMKYRNLVHPTMESSLFKDLDQNGLLVLNLWRSSATFYQTFVDMASSVWMLHKLALSFDPIVEIFQVEKGVDFSMIYMENVIGKGTPLGKTRAKVAFTVVPGFKIGRTVIQSQVYLMGKQATE